MLMEASSIQEVARTCEGEIVRGEPQTQLGGVSTDSRRIKQGDLFIALRGDRHDGHQFTVEAAKRQAACVLVERARLAEPLPACGVIAVPDSRRALGQIAAFNRRRFSLPVVAVAGSNGKTTTKELVAHVLGQRFRTLASEGSFNNDIGVPLTLLRLDNSHQAAVLEAGTNHPGELAPLIQMIQPRYGVITSIGREHLAFFHDLEGVAEEEGWLAELLPANGVLFLSGDDNFCRRLSARTRARVVRSGWKAGNHWRAVEAQVTDRGTVFTVEAPRGEWSGEYRVGLLGYHQVNNALLALAVGAELGLEKGELAAGLARCRPAKMRLELQEASGINILNDAYNANADSMRVALQTFVDVAGDGRKIAVLGDMAELGQAGYAAHNEVGACAAAIGMDCLLAVGSMAPVMCQAAQRAGLSEAKAFVDIQAAAEALRAVARPGDWVLVKASRATALERVIEMLGPIMKDAS